MVLVHVFSYMNFNKYIDTLSCIYVSYMSYTLIKTTIYIARYEYISLTMAIYHLLISIHYTLYILHVYISKG
jgi:hypothetical protein